ncbi:MAG: GerMN domain-containing protein [bacterium]
MKPKKRKTSPKYLRVTFSLALLALVAAGFYYLGSLQRDPQTTSSDNLLKVKLFYYNQRADKVASVERTIPLSQAPIKETINLLLKGELSPQEKSQGFSTEFPHPEFKLLGAALKNGQLALMFTEVPGFTSGGAARVNLLASQIRQTALQFSQVKKVVFDPEYLFQP